AAATITATAPPSPIVSSEITSCSPSVAGASSACRTSSAPWRSSSDPTPSRRTSRPVTSGAAASAPRANPAACASGGPRPAAPRPWLANPATAAAAAASASAGQPILDPSPTSSPSPRSPTTMSRVARSAAATRARIGRGPGHGVAMSGAASRTTRRPRSVPRGSRADTARTAPAMVTPAIPTRAGFTMRARRGGGSRLRRGGRELRVVGGVDDRERGDGPVAQPGTADHVLDVHRSELSRVRGVPPMVAHEKQLALRDDPGAGTDDVLGRLGDVIGVLEDIGLDELGPVQIDEPLLQLDLVAADADDPLDVGLTVLLDPVLRRIE